MLVTKTLENLLKNREAENDLLERSDGFELDPAVLLEDLDPNRRVNEEHGTSKQEG
jgi:hypothetical protein